MNKPFIIGITGGSASGKTLFLDKLLNTFQSGQVCLISQDNYYKARHLQPMDDKGFHNFDTPSSIDFEQYADVIVPNNHNFDKALDVIKTYLRAKISF